MTDFPTLSRYPKENFKQDLAYDPSMRSQTENGIIISRARFTATKKKWEIEYRYLTNDDKILLETLQDDVMVGASVFNWTNPDVNDETIYSVRLENSIQFVREEDSDSLWSASFILIEA